MKIGLIIYGSLDIVTGGFLYDRRIVEYLEGRGHEVQVFALPWRTYPSHLSDNYRRDFQRQLTDATVDLWLEDELNHPSLLMVNRKLTAPIVSIVHHLRCDEIRPNWQNKAYRFIEQLYLRGVDGFVFNSQTTKASVEKLLYFRKAHCVAYPGRESMNETLELDEIFSRALQNGPLRVLFVGSLIPRKELSTLIAALSLLDKTTWTLDIVGNTETDPDYTSVIRDLIARNDLGERIQFHGVLERHELVRMYRQSHLLAVPSSYEGFGIVYLEGMGYGLPAIASNTGAAHETVIHGENGFLVNPGDAQSISNYVKFFCDNRDKLFEMGKAGLKKYNSHPTWEQTGAIVEQFLKNLYSFHN